MTFAAASGFLAGRRIRSIAGQNIPDIHRLNRQGNAAA